MEKKVEGKAKGKVMPVIPKGIADLVGKGNAYLQQEDQSIGSIRYNQTKEVLVPLMLAMEKEAKGRKVSLTSLWIDFSKVNPFFSSINVIRAREYLALLKGFPNKEEWEKGIRQLILRKGNSKADPSKNQNPRSFSFKKFIANIPLASDNTLNDLLSAIQKELVRRQAQAFLQAKEKQVASK